MKRRDFVAVLGGAAVFRPLVTRAQKAAPVIGVLGSTSPGPYTPFVAAFRRGLSDTGFVEGQNVSFEFRWAEGRYDRLPALAGDLVSGKVDLILTSGGTPSAQAAKTATSTIPIVFATGGDAVWDGLVVSLARPGGNLTKISFLTAELDPKRIDLLSELVPQARVIALLVNPANPQSERQPEEREGARPGGSAIAAAAGQRGHRVSDRSDRFRSSIGPAFKQWQKRARSEARCFQLGLC